MNGVAERKKFALLHHFFFSKLKFAIKPASGCIALHCFLRYTPKRAERVYITVIYLARYTQMAFSGAIEFKIGCKGVFGDSFSDLLHHLAQILL